MNAAYDYDLVVIGSGPAGEKGAAQTAYFGKKVALVERSSYLGGAGLNTGTVPSKTLRETALFFSGLRQRGLILVNEKYQTSVSNIYAAGDVIGFPALASTSMEQARVAMVHAFNLRYKEQVSPILPLAVYTIPEISMVGLSEDDCQKKNIPYLVGRAYYENNARGQIIGDLSGLLKLVFSPADKKLLGVHLIGEMAAELVHIGAQIIAAEGTIDAFILSVYNYPSLSDAYKYAAYDGLGNLNRDRAKRICVTSVTDG
jgi:pyruvate/2-oxoglutarate dehydrogenase complex dihydrolipoamide dehydrogenase (E3) component